MASCLSCPTGFRPVVSLTDRRDALFSGNWKPLSTNAGLTVEVGAVKRFFQSEIGSALLWVVCSLVMAALVTPWVYQAGMRLAAAAEAQHLPGMLAWLGAACGRAKFPRFFDRCLLVSALVLLPLLFRRIAKVRSAADAGWSNFGTPVAWQAVIGQIVVGGVIAGGMLWGLGVILEVLGAYTLKTDVPALGSLLPKILIPAAAVSLLEEWLFRGVLLGLWLRFSDTVSACIGTSLLFAFVHFLKPPDGVIIRDPANALAGFGLLGNILLHFTDPLFFVTDFASLLAVGLILAWARVRTGALWFPIGLHAGWIMAYVGFNLYHHTVSGHPLRPWGVGDTLRSGVLPLLTLGLTAVICHFAMRRFAGKAQAVSPASR